MQLRISLLPLLILSFLSCTSPSNAPTPSDEPSLDDMIGQMIMIGFRGMEAEELSDDIKSQIRAGQIGGLILFDYDLESRRAVRNISSPQQVKSLIRSLQEIAPTPLLVAIDQEGGRVNRLKPTYGFPKTVSAQYLGQLDELDSTRHYATTNALTLQEMGFNVNFAPVVDIDLNPNNPVIGGYERSYGDRTALIIKHAKAWIQQHDALGILSTLKHFPGHGSSSSDSHAGFTDVSKLWQEKELLPFRELSQLDQQVAIMTAHVFNNQLDSVYPATLSEKVIQGIIRERWGFEGLVFSDDLQMGAVNDLYDFETILERSILAGVDVLVFGNNLEYDETIPQKALATIKALIEKGAIPEDRIRTSYERVMRAKAKD